MIPTMGVRAVIFLLTLMATLCIQPLNPVLAQDNSNVERPNIILIVTDDQNVASAAHMPVVNAELAAKGVTFINGFVVSPQCCPSRVSILRGQYVHNHHIIHGKGRYGGFKKVYADGLEQSTLALWLKNVGYRTALFGKYLNQYPSKNTPTYIPPGWDAWYAWWRDDQVSTQVSSYYGYFLNENGIVNQYQNAEADYITDVLADRVVTFIEDAAASSDDAPFFAYIAPSAPHAPSIPAARHVNLYADVKLPVSPAFNEDDMSDKPLALQKLRRHSTKQEQMLTKFYRNQLRALRSVDEMIARILKTLEQTNQLENTYIVYISDNGMHFGEHRLGKGKGTAYEEDIRVPFFVRGPGVSAGITQEHMVLNIDLAPTIADIAGATIPDFVDGRSILPLLNASSPMTFRSVFVVTLGTDDNVTCVTEDAGINCFNALRTSRYSYIVHRVTGEKELYDLETDPYQLNNLLYGSPSTNVRNLQRALHLRLMSMLQCSGESCRRIENWPLSSHLLAATPLSTNLLTATPTP